VKRQALAFENISSGFCLSKACQLSLRHWASLCSRWRSLKLVQFMTTPELEILGHVGSDNQSGQTALVLNILYAPHGASGGRWRQRLLLRPVTALLPHGSHRHSGGLALAGLLLLTVGIQDTSAVHMPYHPDGSHTSVASELYSWASVICSIAW